MRVRVLAISHHPLSDWIGAKHTWASRAKRKTGEITTDRIGLNRQRPKRASGLSVSSALVRCQLPCENSSCRDLVAAFVRLLVLTPFCRDAPMKWHIRDLRRRFSSWW